MTPKIYLINLARSPDRLGFMERQLTRMGLAFERIEAVDGKDLTAELISKLAVPERVEEWKFLLTPNAIGCALAHRSAYQMFLKDGGETAIIMEDDVELLDGFKDAAAACANHLPTDAVALLYFHGGRHKFSSRGSISLGDGRSLHEALTAWGAYTAGAYLLSRTTAQRIADFNFPVYTTADSWGVFRRDGPIVSLWAVLPPITAPAHFSSDIGYSWKSRLGRTIERIAGRKTSVAMRRITGSEVQLQYEILDEATE